MGVECRQSDARSLWYIGDFLAHVSRSRRETPTAAQLGRLLAFLVPVVGPTLYLLTRPRLPNE